jgi:hypothetical protein
LCLAAVAGSRYVPLDAKAQPRGPDDFIAAVHVDGCGNPKRIVRVSPATFSQSRTRAAALAKQFSDSVRADHERRGMHAIGAARAGNGVVSKKVDRVSAEIQVTKSQGTPKSVAPERSRGGARDLTMARLKKDSLHAMPTVVIEGLLRTFTPGRSSAADSSIACAGAAQPEFQDAQRLINADATFGPLVQVVTVPGSELLKSASDFNGKFRWVAIAYVTLDRGMDATSYARLSRYTALHLAPNMNCVFIGRFDGKWRARIQPAVQSTCGDAVSASGSDMRMFASRDYEAGAIPAASRIIEGRNMAPFIGVRCGRAWCTIGASSSEEIGRPIHADAMSLPHAPPSNNQSQLDAWFDDQSLAVLDPATNTFRPGFRAAIIPDAKLQQRTSADYMAGWVPVSYVYAPNDPPQKYVDSFGYRKGWNQVYIHHDGAVWSAMIVDPLDNATVRAITNYPHTVGNVRGSARWAWWDADEWIWAPCDDGCCLVQEGR